MSEEENNNVSENECNNDANFDKFYNDHKEKKDVAMKSRRKMPPKSQKQLDAFKKVREIRKQRVIERHKLQEETSKEKRDIEKLYREFIKDKLNKNNKPIEQKQEREQEEEQEIEPEPIIIKRKIKPKPKKIIIEEESEEEPEPIIIKAKSKPKPKVVINYPMDDEEMNYLRETNY